MYGQLCQADPHSSDEDNKSEIEEKVCFGKRKFYDSFSQDSEGSETPYSYDKKYKRFKDEANTSGNDSYHKYNETSSDNDSIDDKNKNQSHTAKFEVSSDNDSTDENHRPFFGRSTNANEGFGSLSALTEDDSKVSDKEQSGSKKGEKQLSIAEKLMLKLGYEKGKGLGKNLQGINEPVATSTQKGRRGLGLELKELKKACIEFDPKDEVVKIEEDVTWIESYENDTLQFSEMKDWIIEGPKKDTVENETYFCDEQIVAGVVNSKSVFDRLDKNEMYNARTRSNPFETIRGVFFLNRAAVKMANIDRAYDFLFTKPPNLQPSELLYFADVCAGPGGFSEYVLWRKKWRAKGFGFTLTGENDFKLHDFHAGPSETFHPYYGPKRNGDVYDPENQLALKKLILHQTQGVGVHFMMSDGGFSYDGQENIQEILSKQLYLCQCLIALMIVRVGGNFVTKLFDIFTPFSVGLVYIMYRCFKKISIFKPNTSRPANSERYLICKEKRDNIEGVIDYLFNINKKLLKKNRQNDVLEIVPIEKIISDEKFFTYVKNSNEELGRRQIISLKKIAAYAEDNSLVEKRQSTLRTNCLQYWQIPDQPKMIPPRLAPSTFEAQLIKDTNVLAKLNKRENCHFLSKENFPNIFRSPFDWFCMLTNTSKNEEERNATFYLSQGKGQVYQYKNGSWKIVCKTYGDVELPAGTLVYAEMVQEFKNESKSQSKLNCLHIIDAFSLGEENISHKFLAERHKLIELFAEALWKPPEALQIVVEIQHIPVRVKELFNVNAGLVKEITLSPKAMKNGTKALGYNPTQKFYEINDADKGYYLIPKSIIFFKAIDGPWACHFSNSKSKIYYYNKNDKQSLWELPEQARANFFTVIQTKVIWNWPESNEYPVEEFINDIKYLK